MSQTPPPGSVGWIDLCCEQAETVRDFYAKVLGWTHQAVPMDGYEDWCMLPSGSESPVSGICHRRGCNQNAPTGWMVYFTVTDLNAALERVTADGGKIVTAPKSSEDKVAIIQDPQGATCALYQT